MAMWSEWREVMCRRLTVCHCSCCFAFYGTRRCFGTERIWADQLLGHGVQMLLGGRRLC